MTTINEQLHNSATHAPGVDPNCPVCNPSVVQRPELPEESVEVEVRLRLEIWDSKQFRQAAYKRALEDGLDNEEAKEYLDEEEKSLGECAMMLLDPGVGPAGSDIEESSCIE